MQFQLLNLSSAPKSIQTDKQKEIINCSRNSQIGIKFKKSDGLLSNQIFNSKIQSAPLTAPFSARNSIIMCQSEIQSQNDQKMNEQQDQNDKYRWMHQVPQNIINKQTPQTQKIQKQRYFVQDYSQLHPNPYQDPIYIKNQFQTYSQINTNIKFQKSKNKNLNQNTYQSQITSQNSGFKLLTKQQKTNTNKPKDGHIIITLPQNQKKFDSFSQKQRQQSKSLDQIKINEHFKRLLQTSESRELYSKPFCYSQYSQISKIPFQSSLEKYTQNLYKPITKQRTKSQQRGNQSLEQNQNYSYDQPQQQYYSDDSFEGKPQNVKKVDLYQLAQERQQHFNYVQNNTNLKSHENSKNQYQESPTQNSQNYQMTLQSSQFYQSTKDIEEQTRNSNLQEYSNFHYFQDNQIPNQIQQNPFSQTSKKPIQIKLNIKEFIASEQQQRSSPMSSNLLQQKIGNLNTHH
ncbi:unnamed protein product [Paramecium pentaurelia]|uniref:Uncharacterized protein n=1 Tax=Paramecium pentaurelia TaxID=43138 RepID=A0A8S1X096_9CILI|nr:unnamed protein product [Paramecium pentaurelia]